MRDFVIISCAVFGYATVLSALPFAVVCLLEDLRHTLRMYFGFDD